MTDCGALSAATTFSGWPRREKRAVYADRGDPTIATRGAMSPAPRRRLYGVCRGAARTCVLYATPVAARARSTRARTKASGPNRNAIANDAKNPFLRYAKNVVRS